MCGSGSFVVEAAQAALGILPGSLRTFGFERLENFDEAAWRGIRDDASVVVLHFEDEKALGQWLDSPARAEWVQKLRARIGDFELQKLPGGFGPWFARCTSSSSSRWLSSASGSEETGR